VARDIAFVHPAKLLRSSTFRIALFYAGLFAVSAMILLGFVYWTVGNYMERQIELSIDADVAELITDAGVSSAPQLAQAVTRHIERSPQDPGVLRVEDAAGHALAGNMPDLASLVPDGGWFEATTPNKSDH
jgi:hypothetical protein